MMYKASGWFLCLEQADREEWNFRCLDEEDGLATEGGSLREAIYKKGV